MYIVSRAAPITLSYYAGGHVDRHPEKSDRSAIPAQPHRDGEECRGDEEPNPQTGTAHKFSEVEVSQHQDAALHLARLRAAAQARRDHYAAMRSLEGHHLDA